MKTPQLFRNFLKLILGVGLVLSASLAFAQDTESANLGTARVVDFQGYAIITKNSDGGAVPLEEGMLLTEGYSITTAANSSLVLVLSNGVVLYIGPNTTIEFETFTQQLSGTDQPGISRPLSEQGAETGSSQVVISLTSGTLYVDSSGLNPDSSFSIKDPNVTTHLSSETGSFVQHTAGQRSIVEVTQGSVSAQGANESAASNKDSGEHHYEAGSPAQQVQTGFALDSNVQQRINIVKSSSSAPAPLTPGQASQLPVATATTNAAGQQQPTPSTPETPGTEEGQQQDASQPDNNNIQDANNRNFTNPVTGEQVFSSPDTVSDPSDDVISVIE